MSNREDYKDQRRVRHDTPIVGDAVYIEGDWIMQEGVRVWRKANFSRVNGKVYRIDYDTQEVIVLFKEHEYADPNEPKVWRIDFATFYGRWDANRDCYVLKDYQLA